MNRRALGWTLVSGLAGAACLHVYLKRFESEVAGGPARAVITVTRDLAAGDVLTGEDLGPRPMPERYVEERHVPAEELDRVLGARLTTPLTSGSSLLWSDLDVMQGGRTLSSLVRAGMRAYVLSARDVMFENLVRAGDRVDVLWTSAADGGRTLTLLENVLVLVAGAGAQSDATEGAIGVAGALALSVTSAQAEHLAQSEQRGRLTLTLRNPQDIVLSQRASTAAGVCQEGASCP